MAKPTDAAPGPPNTPPGQRPNITGSLSFTRHRGDDGTPVTAIEALNEDGTEMPLAEALGMLWLAGDRLIRERIGEV